MLTSSSTMARTTQVGKGSGASVVMQRAIVATVPPPLSLFATLGASGLAALTDGVAWVWTTLLAQEVRLPSAEHVRCAHCCRLVLGKEGSKGELC